jgi:DNA polymerase-3 subunit alpha/error-prone DNA polymerase
LSIKGLAAATQERIVGLRHSRPYDGFGDFQDRVQPDESETRALIRCGALDTILPGARRADLRWELARWLKSRSAVKSPTQGSLFEARPAAGGIPPLPPEDPTERRRREFAVLGFLCDRHPMELYAGAVLRAGAVKAVDIPRRVGRRVRFAGWLITGKVVETRKGEPMEFLTFEDETGLVETTFFPDAYRRFCHLLDRDRPYLLSGKVEEDWGAVTLTVESVSALTAPAETSRSEAG